MGKYSLNVIVPVYNMEKYISLCIDSLLSQTYEHFRIILVNDYSTDTSLSILRDYEQRYPERILVINSDVNLKQGGARNLGIRASESDYVGFVDADDFIHPKMYELLMKEADKNGSDAVYCGYKIVDEMAVKDDYDTTIVAEYRPVYRKFSDNERMEMMAAHEYGSVWGGVYRRSLIEKNGLYFPEHLSYEDNFWVYALQMNINTASFLSVPLYFYRQQQDSTVHKKNATHHYDRIEIGKYLLSYAMDKHLFQKYHTVLEFLFIEVFTLNSCNLFISAFDHPQINKINQVKGLLKDTFPKWRKNQFYKDKFSLKQKIKVNLLMTIPTRMYVYLMNII